MKKINSIQNNEVLNKSELYNQSSDPINKMLQESYAYEKIFPGKDSEKEIGKILEVIQILNSMVPITFPQYNFNPDEINGEYYYKPDGTLLLIREYEKDIIRDYYYDKDNNTISRIQEHDKNNGRIKAKIDPAKKKNKNTKFSITIFDEKINNKYMIIQVAENGVVSSFSEFCSTGQSFKTLFRDTSTSKPVRYLTGGDNINGKFEMFDCILDAEGKIARIKQYTSTHEVNINYVNKQKIVKVKKI